MKHKIIAAILILCIGIVICSFRIINKNKYFNRDNNKIETNIPTKESGEVIEQNEYNIDESDKELDAIKKRRKAMDKESLGDLQIEDGKVKSDDKYIKYEILKEELKPDIDWSDGEVSQQELLELTNIGAKLIEERMKQSSSYGEVYVTAELPTLENLEKFENTVFYYVKDGTITLNMKLAVYLLDSNKRKEILVPVSFVYNIDKVELEK